MGWGGMGMRGAPGGRGVPRGRGGGRGGRGDYSGWAGAAYGTGYPSYGAGTTRSKLYLVVCLKF
jgi:hypothetical protein